MGVSSPEQQENFVVYRPGVWPMVANDDDRSNLKKDPDDWVSGDDPMTGAQASYLQTLAEQAHQPIELAKEMTKAEASKLIDELRGKVGLKNE
jgi:hypothetical protein